MSKDSEDTDYVRDLMIATKSHGQWLVVVRFGLATLLENQPLLLEVILKEVVRMDSWSNLDAAQCATEIMRDLGLTIVLDVTAGK